MGMSSLDGTKRPEIRTCVQGFPYQRSMGGTLTV